jgi:hypothetical protein
VHGPELLEVVAAQNRAQVKTRTRLAHRSIGSLVPLWGREHKPGLTRQALEMSIKNQYVSNNEKYL